MKDTIEKWEIEFNKQFGDRTNPNEYFREIFDKWITPKEIKSFIKSLLSQAKEEEKQRIIEIMAWNVTENEGEWNGTEEQRRTVYKDTKEKLLKLSSISTLASEEDI